MVKKLLDKGTYDIVEFLLDVDYRGRTQIRMRGLAKSQEEEVMFEIKFASSVLKAMPSIFEMPKPQKKVGRPRKNEDNE